VSVIVSSGQTSGISSGQTDTGDSVLAGGTLIVSSGGTISNTVVDGGSPANGSLASGIVDFGGSAVSTTIRNSGAQDVFGVASGSVVSSGGIEYVDSGGIVSGTTVSSGGGQYVFSTGTAIGTMVKGGAQLNVRGTTSNVVLSGGSPGGFAIDTVYFGGRAVSTTLETSSILGIFGVASGSIVSSGGELSLFPGGHGNLTTISAGGTEYIDANGTEIGALISGGTQLDFGVASGGTVFAGSAVVESGGIASNTTVLSGGTLFVLSSGVADPTIVSSGGSEVVSGGGTDLGALVSGGTQLDYGLASGGAVFAGLQDVESGGIASDTVVGTLGTQVISP
jgi:fibronectin-binding autotransporter adhesin